MLKSTLLLSAAVLFAFVPCGVGRTQQSAAAPAQAAAPAPAPEIAMKNPVKPTADSQAKAKQLYSIDCAMCHNDNGNGKTSLASSMKLSLPDLSDPKTLESVSDGELFSLFRNGKDKMPPESVARANNNEIWNLVIYVRGLSKPQTGAAMKPAHATGK